MLNKTNKLLKYEIESFELDYITSFEMGSVMFWTKENIIHSIIKDNNIIHSIQNIYKIIVEREIYSLCDTLNDRMNVFKDGAKTIKNYNENKLDLLSKKIPKDIVYCMISKYFWISLYSRSNR